MQFNILLRQRSCRQYHKIKLYTRIERRGTRKDHGRRLNQRGGRDYLALAKAALAAAFFAAARFRWSFLFSARVLFFPPCPPFAPPPPAPDPLLLEALPPPPPAASESAAAVAARASPIPARVPQPVCRMVCSCEGEE